MLNQTRRGHRAIEEHPDASSSNDGTGQALGYRGAEIHVTVKVAF
jgi:hypothetical protein